MNQIKYNNEFSITFWIDIYKNPAWLKEDSEIIFPMFTVKNGIIVFFSKIKEKLKVYLLHPEIGYRKLVVDVSKYIGSKTFVALTNSSEETILYLNAVQVCILKVNENVESLEIGDYVMVVVKNGELEGLKIEGDIEVMLPAKILKISDNKMQFEFFTTGDKLKIAELDKTRIKK